MIKSNDIEREVNEIKIKVPWGHIAGKWWGSKSIRSIVCIHGWQDNAGSFDSLIPHLPDHLSYFAVDLPGHGLSSRIPNGMNYSLKSYFYCLVLICEHFRWEKVSLMGHSLGSVINFLFAAAFPSKCDLVIGLDSLRPYDVNPDVVYQNWSIGMSVLHKADTINCEVSDTEPPSFVYEELSSKIRSGLFLEIFEEAAPYLLQRAVKPSKYDPDKYFFTRDGRLKAVPIPMMANEVSNFFAENIVAPYCFIKTSMGPIDEESHYNKILQIMQKNPLFEVHNVQGHHHVHLNEPSKLKEILSSFIHKYRPSTCPNLSSKLLLPEIHSLSENSRKLWEYVKAAIACGFDDTLRYKHLEAHSTSRSGFCDFVKYLTPKC